MTPKTKPTSSRWKKLGLTLGYSLLALFIFTISLIGLVLFHPGAPNQLWPKLESWTQGTLSIERSEGTLYRGLRLYNLKFQNPQIQIELEQLQWQWSLSQWLSGHYHLDQLALSELSIDLVSQQETKAKDPNAPMFDQPFAFLQALNLPFSIADLSLNGFQLSQNQQPQLNVEQLQTQLHWQPNQLSLSAFFIQLNAPTPYQAWLDGEITFIDASNFSAEIDARLQGIENIEAVELQTQWKGQLDKTSFVELDLSSLQPYQTTSHHRLELDLQQLTLYSDWIETYAEITTDWSVNQFSGQTELKYDLNAPLVSLEAQWNMQINDWPSQAVEFKIGVQEQDLIQYQLKLDMAAFGKLASHGKIHWLERLVELEFETHELQTLPFFEAHDYTVTTQLHWQLSDYAQRQSRLDISRFELEGLDEPLILSAQLASKRLADSRYQLDLTSSGLRYGDYQGQAEIRAQMQPDFSQITIPQSRFILGDNQLELQADWAEQFEITLNAKLNRLEQLLPKRDILGDLSVEFSAQGQLDSDFAIEQAWSQLRLESDELFYQNHLINGIQLQAETPLHQPEWTEFKLVLGQVFNQPNTDEKQEAATLLIDSLTLTRKASPEQSDQTGLTSELALSHPLLSLKAQIQEPQPSLEAGLLDINWLEFDQAHTGLWRLEQPSQLNWQAPNLWELSRSCLRSADDSLAFFCLESNNDQAQWQAQSLPIIDWLAPWIPANIQAHGRLNAQGLINWQDELRLEQTLQIPELELQITEQGYDWPMTLTNLTSQLNWQQNQARFHANAQVNDSGQFNAEIKAYPTPDWQQAELDGHIRLQLHEWRLSPDFTRQLELHKTQLDLQTTLLGSLQALKHNTRANIEVDFDLPLLGLSAQSIQLQAQLDEQGVAAFGRLSQPQGREARVELEFETDEQRKPQINISLQTDSIEVLKTPFANLFTQADLTLNMQADKAHLAGRAQLHNSFINLDQMPLHERTKVSSDEVIISPQGEVVAETGSDFELSYQIHLGFGDQVKINARDAEAFLGGGIQLEDNPNLEEMRANGEITILNGHIKLDARNQIQIDQSSFSFTGAIANPTLNVNLFRQVDRTTARLNITGTSSQPQFVFYSTPPQSQARIINLMVFGRAGDMTNEPNYESQILTAFYKLGIQNNAPILNRLSQTLGIEDIYFDVQDQQVSSLLLGRALTDELYVRYARDLSGKQGNAVQVFYQLTPNWLLKSDSGSESTSVDLIFRRER